MTTPGRARVQVNIRSFSFKIRYVNVARSGRIPFKKTSLHSSFIESFQMFCFHTLSLTSQLN